MLTAVTLLLCLLRLGFTQEMVDTACVEGACPSVGLSALQARSSRSSSSVEVAEDEGLEVESFRGAEVIVHAGSDVKRKGRGRWIITVKDGCTDADVKKLAEHMPKGTVPVYEGSPSEGGLCIFVMEGTKAQVLEELASHELPMDKVVCEADQEVKAVPEMPVSTSLVQVGDVASWGLDRVDDATGLDGDYSYPGKGGEGVHVYVLDTGVRTTHADFEGRAIPAWDMSSGSAVACTDASCAADINGHGTHCAGTVAGRSYGVAPKAQVHAVKVLGDGGSGASSWICQGLDKVMAATASPKVASLSLGIRGSSRSVKNAVVRAVEGGVTVVVAAGNEASNACYNTPASVSEAITVGATDRDDYRSTFSNYGSCLDIFAPGSDIVSAGNSGDSASDVLSGTSMACPHVAGAAALLLGEDKGKTPSDVLRVLLERSGSNMVQYKGWGSPNQLLRVS